MGLKIGQFVMHVLGDGPYEVIGTGRDYDNLHERWINTGDGKEPERDYRPLTVADFTEIRAKAFAEGADAQFARDGERLTLDPANNPYRAPEPNVVRPDGSE